VVYYRWCVASAGVSSLVRFGQMWSDANVCCAPLLFLLLPRHTPVPTAQCNIAWLPSLHLYWTKTKMKSVAVVIPRTIELLETLSPVQTPNRGFASGVWTPLGTFVPRPWQYAAGVRGCQNTPQLKSSHHVFICTFGHVS